jgi:hypothetical protein
MFTFNLAAVTLLADDDPPLIDLKPLLARLAALGDHLVVPLVIAALIGLVSLIALVYQKRRNKS